MKRRGFNALAVKRPKTGDRLKPATGINGFGYLGLRHCGGGFGRSVTLLVALAACTRLLVRSERDRTTL